ncbi:hypothetical protein B0J14DRAFT_680578 [Halenospora varia]|nr:hypothetical protein B0J14DRAFT_680578 [Halenospora varia]
MHDLHADPALKRQILHALKTAPASAIWVNGVCIYRGHEKVFESREEPRGRPFEQPMARRRSRSPKREEERARLRSRSPFRGRSPVERLTYENSFNGFEEGELIDLCSPVRRSRQRSPSPAKEQFGTPSPVSLPAHKPISPQVATESSAIVCEGRGMNERREIPKVQPFKILSRVPQAKPAPPPYLLLQKVNIKQSDSQTRDPLSQITNTNRADNPIKASESQNRGSSVAVSESQQVSQQPSLTAPVAEPEPIVDDPYFVLGIRDGALEPEIVDAYQQKIWEIEIDKMTDGTFTSTDDGTKDPWEESIRILKAAKKQLIGH